MTSQIVEETTSSHTMKTAEIVLPTVGRQYVSSACASATLNGDPNKFIFILGGDDLEMNTIKNLLNLAGITWKQPQAQ